MKTEFVSPEVFWEKMGDCRFVRLGKFQGRVMNVLYVTTKAPEDVPGLIDGAIRRIGRNLGIADDTLCA